MEKSTTHSVGFEILEDNGDSIVLKRVLKQKYSNKDRYKEEMALPKLIVHYFNDEEIDKLQKIEEEIVRKIILNRRNSIYEKILNFFKQ